MEFNKTSSYPSNKPSNQLHGISAPLIERIRDNSRGSALAIVKPMSLNALFQSEQVVLPNAVGISLEKLVACSACTDADRCRHATLRSEEAMGFLLDHADNVRDRFFPTS